MCIDKIDLDIYNRYRDTISRLIELEVCEKRLQQNLFYMHY